VRTSASDLPFELGEADDHVGHLHAGVVDVVLHLHGHAAEAQHPHERVAQRGVAQVPDVRGLVRVDRRVLDDRLAAGASFEPRGRRRIEPRLEERPAVEVGVDVPAGHRLDAGEAGDGGEGRGDFLRDDARRLAQAARQLERDRQGQVAERPVRGVIDTSVGTASPESP
jgi:hypothetical protein